MNRHNNCCNIVQQFDVNKNKNFNSFAITFKLGQLQFTRRETQCLACLILGMTAKQIAEVLFISSRTVEDYIAVIKAKFNCKYRYQVVAKALLNNFPIYEFLQKR